MMGGGVKLVNSNLHRSKNPFMMGGGQPKSTQITFSHLTSLSTSSRLNYSQLKCCLYKGGVTLQIAPIKFWGGIFGQVKSVVKKIAFSKGGVA